MKFEFKQSEKKMFNYVCGSPNECPWMKGQKSA